MQKGLFILLGISFLLVGCTPQPSNTSNNDIDVNDVNEPTANINQPPTSNQNINANQNTTNEQPGNSYFFVNNKYGYKINLFDYGYQTGSNTYGTDANTASDVIIAKQGEPLDTYQGITFKPSLLVAVRAKNNRTLTEIAQANFNLNKKAGYTKGDIIDVTIGGLPAKQFTVAGGLITEVAESKSQERYVIYIVKGESLFEIIVPSNHKILNQIMNSLEFTR